MITFFRDDLQNTTYTDSFLNDTRYYDSIKEVYEAVNSIVKQYEHNRDVDDDKLSSIMMLWDRYAYSRGYKCSPIEDFFFIKDDGMRHEFIMENKKYGIPSFADTTFFTNLYDIQRNVKTSGIRTIDRMQLSKESLKMKINQYEGADKRFVIKLTDKGKASKYIIIRFKFSIGVFDTIEYKMVAYKNFKTGKTFGDWDANVESYVTAIYNTASGIKRKSQCSVTPNSRITSSKTIGKIKQPTVQEDVHKSVTRLHCKELLDSKISRMAQNHGVDTKEVRTNVYESLTPHSIELLNKYEEEQQLAKFEALARRLYDSAFVRFIDHKDLVTCRVTDGAAAYYKKLTGKTLKIPKSTSPRDRDYRQPVERGVLENSRGDRLVGGDNKTHQTQVQLSMNNDDFFKMCSMFGIVNPNQSDLNGIVEQILYQKFDSNSQYTLSKKARLAVLYHRDKREQSEVRKFKTCYLPSEYNEYVTKIQQANYKTDNFKNSKPFVVSVILHEFIGYV